MFAIDKTSYSTTNSYDEMSDNETLINAIICLLKGFNESEGKRKDAYKYLICQCIRQYVLPADHYHVSVSAQELWERLTEEPIERYFYRDVVPCNNLKAPLDVIKYKGASRTGTKDTLYPGGKFVFNDLFQCDHVVPVSIIFYRLKELSLNELTIDGVNSILNEMHICKITKDEDFNLGRTRDRYPSFMQTITEGTYKDVTLVEDKFLLEHGYKQR